MPAADLSPQFDPTAVERDIYARWDEAGVFTARAARSTRVGGDREPFTIVIPPPNVTAVLHMGHGFNNTVQDVITRWRRMAGDEALYLPGTDHAGIATQNVVEKLIAKCGKTRFDVGREAFIERVKTFVEETGGVILQQLRAIGCSCDWSRTAYTFSPALSRAVREAFVRLWEAGLIYKGHRVIHWCPRCLTSLSDEEAEHHDVEGKLYHVSYPLVDDPTKAITIATTRPETILADVAIAVHPKDDRYRALVGRSVMVPIANVAIPIIADENADPAFGSGAVKITPAHDANDFDVGVRHTLDMPVVIDESGFVREVADADGRVPDSLRGLDRVDARARMVELLRAAGRLVKVEPHHHAIRQCYRCDTVVEPRLSDQWFVKMQPLAARALEAHRDGSVRILPERWEATYVNWLENIRDWNISRQIWWGHRIPVWYCDACGGEPIVSRDDVSACATCGGAVRQDEDVLDTWFSSQLWPYSTLGWPDETALDLRAFYPTDVLVTGPDIIFFWVARMIMSGYFFLGRAPFHTVYLNGMVRDVHNRKMSKSLGNGIDPLDVVARFGADALRYTVISGMGYGTDVKLDPDNLEESFAPGRNFVTKLWNIGRFLLSNVEGGAVRALGEIDAACLTRADRWILARLDAAIAEVDAALGAAHPAAGALWGESERYIGLRLMEFTEVARRFTWDELAAWYLESTKSRLLAGGDDADVARSVLVHVFDQALRLLHPVVPFITEALWQRLPGRVDGAFVAAAAWPTIRVPLPDERGNDAEEFERVRDAVLRIRQLRVEYNIGPATAIAVAIMPATDEARRIFAEDAAMTGRLPGVRAAITIATGAPAEPAAQAMLADGSELYLLLAGAVDVDKECARLTGELAALEQQLGALRGRLGNDGFVSRAPAHVVEAERHKERDWSARREHLAAKVATLCGR
ncbi:MAG: valine--tRNA ligase [Gemmatimonadaceae bacterium]